MYMFDFDKYYRTATICYINYAKVVKNDIIFKIIPVKS